MLHMLQFTQNADLREVLMATGKSKLVEASPFDQLWDIGLAADDPERRTKPNGEAKTG
jgi:predicted NAD-dependent protein-ADP-ribosyltransferase YbiA (DUF1768 family)